MTYNATTGHLDMTMTEWKALHRDFKGTQTNATTGKKYRTALHFVPGTGTCIVPVAIVKETK